jgi:hypothetical protein
MNWEGIPNDLDAYQQALDASRPQRTPRAAIHCRMRKYLSLLPGRRSRRELLLSSRSGSSDLDPPDGTAPSDNWSMALR